MRIRPLTRSEIDRIRQRNVRYRQRYEQWLGERRSKRRLEPKIPHGPMSFCQNCGTLTKQRTVYAKLPLLQGRQVWEGLFMLCLNCMNERKTDLPLIHITRRVYSLLSRAEGILLNRVAALVVSILKEGPLPFERVVRRLRTAELVALEPEIGERVLKPMVEAELISVEEVDYTDLVTARVLASGMRLKACPKDLRKTVLPVYIQFREEKASMQLRVKRLGLFCLNCQSLTFDDEPGVRNLLKMTEGVYAFSYDSQASTNHRRRRRRKIVWETLLPTM